MSSSYHFENIKIEMLEAQKGDSILVTITDINSSFRLLIDGGVRSTYHKNKIDGELKKKLEYLDITGEAIDLLVLTHVDEDHIGGLKEWFKDKFPSNDFVRCFWFNDENAITVYNNRSTNDTVQKAFSLQQMMDAHNFHYESGLLKGVVKKYPWGCIRVLAPDADNYKQIVADWNKLLSDSGIPTNYKKSIKQLVSNYTWDTVGKCTPENKASIALLLEVHGFNYLFLGDADIDIVSQSLIELGYSEQNPLICKWVKLSHHGSSRNFSPAFLKLIRSEVFAVSTDGKSKDHHPNKEVLAWIVEHTNSKIQFNYPKIVRDIFLKDDFRDYPDLQNRIQF